MSCANAGCESAGHHCCSKCKVQFYCSRDCQLADWKKHKEICSQIIKTNDSKVPKKRQQQRLAPATILPPSSNDYMLIYSYAKDFFFQRELRAAEQYARKALRMCQNIHRK